MSLDSKTLNREPARIDSGDDWQVRVLVAGGIVGAAVGLLTSYLLVRTSRETRGGPPSISTGDALKVGITAIGLIRAIAALGDRR